MKAYADPADMDRAQPLSEHAKVCIKHIFEVNLKPASRCIPHAAGLAEGT